MNASPVNLNPVQAAQAALQAGKDATSPDVPFSQVLSGEMAQNRKNDAAREHADASSDSDASGQAANPAEGKTGAPHHAKSGEASSSGRSAADTEEDAVAPETLLALAISPDAFRPTGSPPGTMLATAEPDSTTPAAFTAAAPNGLKGRPGPVMLSGQPANDAHGAQELDPSLSGKDDMRMTGGAARTATPADLASMLPGQLAAARQADATKTGELLPDLMSNPLMRPAPHAPVETKLAAAEAASPRLAPSVGTAAWGQALGDKLVWMAAGAQQTASITLNPPNLGPLQIVLNVTNDQATASFFSAQPEVRQALEAAFPRLREMMNDAGIQLGQATVSADTPRQQNDTPDRQAQRVAPPFPGTDSATPAGVQAALAPSRHAGRGLVDTFA